MLAGGERSFTMLAFISALISVVGSPFHCMDEIDVFMDSINRLARGLPFSPSCQNRTSRFLA